jgi:two-component system sensor histidine kinase GlrK
VVEAHHLAAQAKHQTVALELTPVNLEGDAQKLRTALDNLVGNAVKFTPDGGSITVVSGEQRGCAVIDVIDSGPGVPPEERDSIFNSFFRGRARAGSRIEGSGLGLAIARDLVQAHGGSIGLLPATRGAHFRVVLPLRGEAVPGVAA